jgi:hypothetical protein
MENWPSWMCHLGKRPGANDPERLMEESLKV